MSWGFDFNDVKEESNVLPAGSYTVQVVKAEMKQTKSGNGSYLNVQFKVLAPTYVGKTLFNMFNIVNENETAQNIGRSQLKSMIKALGIKDVNAASPADFIGKVCDIKTSVRVDSYGEKEVIKSFALSSLNALPKVDASVPF